MASGPPSTQRLNIQRCLPSSWMSTPNRHPHVVPLASATSQTSLVSTHEPYDITSFMSCADDIGVYISSFLLCVFRSSLPAIRRGISFPDILQGWKRVVCTNKCLRLPFFRVIPFINQTTFPLCQNHYHYSSASGQCIPVHHHLKMSECHSPTFRSILQHSGQQ